MEYPEWVELGRYLGAVGRGSQWWIGDWLLYARGKWGEMYTEAVKITGYDYGTLRNRASLAQEFDLSRRRDKLSWDHHAAVAGLAPSEQDHWLNRAAELKWSREDLRIALRTERRARQQTLEQAPEGGDPPPATEDLPVRGLQPAESLTAHDGNGIVCPNCGHKLPLLGYSEGELAPVAKPTRRSRRTCVPAAA
jgi:hypothetical protein